MMTVIIYHYLENVVFMYSPQGLSACSFTVSTLDSPPPFLHHTYTLHHFSHFNPRKNTVGCLWTFPDDLNMASIMVNLPVI